MKLKEKIFKKMLEKPINDILIVSYDLYHNACRVYLDENDILSLEDYCILVNDKLKNLYNTEV